MNEPPQLPPHKHVVHSIIGSTAPASEDKEKLACCLLAFTLTGTQ